MEGGKKCLCLVFRLAEDREFVEKKCDFGHPIVRAISCCLLPDTF